MQVHCKGQRVSGSACHAGRKMIMLHLYFEEMHCAFSWPTIILMFIATLTAMLLR